MDCSGGIVSVELDATEVETRTFIEKLAVFTVADSLGSVESLGDHPQTTSASYLSPAARRAAGLSDSLVRIPVDIEDEADLVSDIQQALSPL